MFFYEKIIKINSKLDKKEQRIVDLLNEIPDETIDIEKSKVFLQSDFIHIELNGVLSLHYPMKLFIGINKKKYKIFFFVGHIYIHDYDDFSNKDDLSEILDELESIFKSNIEIQKHYIGTDLYRIVTLCDKYLEEDGSVIELVEPVKPLWPWKKKKVKIKKKFFKPWIPEDKT